MQRLAMDIPQSNRRQWQVMHNRSTRIKLKTSKQKILLRAQNNNFSLHVLKKLKQFSHKLNELNINVKFQCKCVK